MSKVVIDYQTGQELTGRPSKSLAKASANETTGTGAVLAYLDGNGVWQHIESSEESAYTATGHKVVTVWVA